MKKALSFLLVICFAIVVFSGCGSKGTKLTLDNYEQYLDLSASCLDNAVRCQIKPVTTNYDFNDVEFTIKTHGEYTVYHRIFEGYNSEGWPRYNCTIPHSNGTYDETFTLKLNIGGTVINTEDATVYLPSPSGTTINSGTCEYEIVSISGTVTRIK